MFGHYKKCHSKYSYAYAYLLNAYDNAYQIVKKRKQVFSEQWEDVSIVYIITSRISEQFSSVQLLSHIQLFVTQWTAARQASLSITNSWS